MGLASKFADQVGNDVTVANHHSTAHALTASAVPVQPFPELEPHQQVETRQTGQRHDNVASGEVGLGRVGGDSYGGGEAHSGVQDAPELMGADADEPTVVGAGEGERGEPEQREY